MDVDRQAGQALEEAENTRVIQTKRAQEKAASELEKIVLKKQKVELTFHTTCTALGEQMHHVQAEQDGNVAVAQARLADAKHAKMIFFEKHRDQLGDVVDTASLEDRIPVGRKNPPRTLYEHGEGAPSISVQMTAHRRPPNPHGPGPW